MSFKQGSPRPRTKVKGAAEINLSGVFKGWSWVQQKRKGVSVSLYVINRTNKKNNSTMCVCRMAKAFRATAWAQGMPCRGGWRGMLLPPCAAHGPRCTSRSGLPSNFWRSTGDSSPKTHLPTCRLWYTQRLQIPVQKKRKNTPNTTTAWQRPPAPAAQSVWMLALSSAPRAACAGSSPFPSRGALAASAKGFRLITRSSLSPASEIRGTARQQSKSLVRMRFTCRDGFRMCHGEEQQKHRVC